MKTLLIDPAEKSTITITNPHKICRDKGKENCIIEKKRKTTEWCTQKDDDLTILIRNAMDIEEKRQ